MSSDNDFNGDNNGLKKALVIAIGEYNTSDLKSITFCKNDGLEMFKVLEKIGYNISNDFNPIGYMESQILRKTIFDFFINENNKPNDTLIFYFSGHGFQISLAIPILHHLT